MKVCQAKSRRWAWLNSGKHTAKLAITTRRLERTATNNTAPSTQPKARSNLRGTCAKLFISATPKVLTA